MARTKQTKQTKPKGVKKHRTRALSGYQIFMKSYRKENEERVGKAPFNDWVKMISGAWKELGSPGQLKYNDEARKLSGNIEKPPSLPTKGILAFRESKGNDGQPVSEIDAEWGAMSPSKRKPFDDIAADARRSIKEKRMRAATESRDRDIERWNDRKRNMTRAELLEMVNLVFENADGKLRTILFNSMCDEVGAE